MSIAPEAFSGVDVSAEMRKHLENYDARSLILPLMRQPSRATIDERQRCSDANSGTVIRMDNPELTLCAKLAYTAYILPYFMPSVGRHFHQSNLMFSRILQNQFSSSGVAYDHMHQIIHRMTTKINMFPDTQISGFYIRTPIEIKCKGRSIYHVPKWENRKQLLKCDINGNVNTYVLRRNLPNDEFECYICLRGTSNEFNAIPQYGIKMRNTQLLKSPDYDPIHKDHKRGGSNDVPLFYDYYSRMIDNCKESVYKALAIFGWDDPKCKRIVVSGHSMGGGLALTFAYIMYFDNRPMWNKTYFRAFATPYCCNSSAIETLHSWSLGTPDKIYDIVNTDDFVNARRMFGGARHMVQSIQMGIDTVIVEAVRQTLRDDGLQSLFTPTFVARYMHVAQLYPELVSQSFIRGFMSVQRQLDPAQRSDPHRMKGDGISTRVINCERYVAPHSDVITDLHTQYANLNIGDPWSIVRAYEDQLYKIYHRDGLTPENNRYVFIPMFPEQEMVEVTKTLHHINKK